MKYYSQYLPTNEGIILFKSAEGLRDYAKRDLFPRRFLGNVVFSELLGPAVSIVT